MQTSELNKVRDMSEKELRQIIFEEVERAIESWQTNKATWLKAFKKTTKPSK